MPLPPSPVFLDLSKDVVPEPPPPPRWQKRLVMAALLVAVVVVFGAVLDLTEKLQRLFSYIFPPHPADRTAKPSGPLVPISPLEAFDLGVKAITEKRCEDAVQRFEDALTGKVSQAAPEDLPSSATVPAGGTLTLSATERSAAGKAAPPSSPLPGRKVSEEPLSRQDAERAWFLKGSCEYTLKRYADSRASFLNAKELDPTATSIDAWLALIPAASEPRELTAEEKANQEKQAKVAELIKTGKLEECAKAKRIVIQGVDYETVCRNNVALNLALDRLDPSFCDKLDGNLLSIASCKNRVWAAKFANVKELAQCDEAPTGELKSTCQVLYWLNGAVQHDDVTLCDHLTESQTKTECRNSFFLNRLASNPREARCENFSAPLKQDCETLEKALSTPKNSQGCLRIRDVRLQSFCRQRFGF